MELFIIYAILDFSFTTVYQDVISNEQLCNITHILIFDIVNEDNSTAHLKI